MDIPRIGFGTYQLSSECAYQMVKTALKHGYRHIDTAALYKNEEAVGSAIRDSGIDREKIFVTTKIPVKAMLRGKIKQSIQASLERLGLGYIDLVLFHAPIRERVVEDWETLSDLVQQYPIRHIGVSNYDIAELRQILSHCKVKPYANQIEITPFWNRERLAKFCQQNGIRVISHSSLTKGRRLDHPLLAKIASRQNCTTAQVLLNWCLEHDYFVIPRTSQIDHLLENRALEVISFKKEELDDMSSLEEGFATHPQYR